MINKIWPFFILISIIFVVFFGDIEKLNEAIFNSAENAISVTVTLLGTMCIWNGLMKIAFNTSLISFAYKLIKPLISLLFPELKDKEIIKKEISMNVIANFLGLGNAATPLGLKAIKSMQVVNDDKSKLSNSMMTFILLNTASIQLIPTTVISIRKSLGSQNIAQILIPTWCATVCAAVSGIIAVKIIMRTKK